MMLFLTSIKDIPERSGVATRRFIVSMALLSIAGVCLALPLIGAIFALASSDALTYQGWPYPLDAPSDLHPGDPIIYKETICVDNPPGQSLEGYTVDRSLVDEQGFRMPLIRLATGAPPVEGCTTREVKALVLPQTLPPGRYYLEGVATIYSRRRVSNAYFRTEEFTVREVFP